MPPPSHLGVGPHQYAAALGHLPQKHPVVVEVEHLAARPDHEAGDLHTRARGDFCRCLLPGLASNAGEEGEASLACQVQRADSPSGVQQPAVGQACAWPGGGLVIEFRVTGMGRLRRPIGDHGCGAVVLIELDPVAVELVVLVLDGLAQFLSLLGATGRVLFTRLHACAHLPDVPGLAGPEEGIVDQAGLRDALVRTLDDLLADGCPLIVVGLQQRWVRLFLQHQSELPGQVVGVLDGGVRAEPIVRRMPVDGITHTEHAPMRVARCIQMIDAPERCGADLNRDGVVSDQVLHDPGCRRLVEDRWRFVDVIAPNDQPLIPGTHHADGAHPDATDIGAGLQHPVEHSWSVGNVFREVGRDEDIYAARDIYLPDHGQGDVPGDQAASAVSTQQILGPDLIGSAANTVAYRGGHTVGVLLEREVLSVEADPRPTGGGVAEQDRLHQGLRTVADTRRACERIVRHPTRVRAPRTQPSKLLSDQARAEHVIAHKLLGRGLLDDFRLDAHVAQDFHSALVRDVRPRRVRGPAVLGEHHILHAIRAQEERRRPASRAAPNNQDICLDLCVHACLQSCFSFATFG